MSDKSRTAIDVVLDTVDWHEITIHGGMMSTNRPSCDRMSSCVRRANHAGACTACPSSATLDWDDHRDEISARREEAERVLHDLDFETPPWADLRDEDAA